MRACSCAASPPVGGQHAARRVRVLRPAHTGDACGLREGAPDPRLRHTARAARRHGPRRRVGGLRGELRGDCGQRRGALHGARGAARVRECVLALVAFDQDAVSAASCVFGTPYHISPITGAMVSRAHVCCQFGTRRTCCRRRGTIPRTLHRCGVCATVAGAAGNAFSVRVPRSTMAPC